MHLLDRIPLLTMRMINLLSAVSCLVIGTLMIVSYMRHSQYIAAAVSLPLCFALWGIVHLVWRRAGIDSNRVRFAVFHPVRAFRTHLPEDAEVGCSFEDIDKEDDDGYDVEGFDDEDYLG